jgi:transposase-like protein
MSVYGFYKTAKLVHFINKDSKRKWKDKYTRLRGVAEKLGLTPKARQKLEWIIFYETVGKENATYTANYFGITRKTLHKWLKRFDEANLRSLEELSRAPVKRRTWEVTLRQESQIIKLRKKTKCKYGKKKLKKLYFDEYGQSISTWKIERVVRKHRLYREKEVKRAYVKAKRKKKKKILIHDIRKERIWKRIWICLAY